MGLYDTMDTNRTNIKKANAFDDMVMRKKMQVAEDTGETRGRINENRDQAEQIRRQDLIEQKMAEDNKRAMLNFDQGMIRGRQERILAGQTGQNPNEMQMAPDETGASYSEAGQLDEDPNVRAANIMATLGDMQKKNASPEQINDAINSIKQSENNSTLNALQKLQNEMNPEPNPTQGIQPNPTQVPQPTYPQSDATDMSRGIMSNIAEAEMAKKRQAAEQQMMQQQATQQIDENQHNK